MAMDRRVLKTRRAIKSALHELLMEKDSLKITITEIARRADVDRKTFYLHYDSINDVIRDVSRERLDTFDQEIRKQELEGKILDVTLIFKTLNIMIEDDIELYRHIAKNPGFSTFWVETKDIIERSLLRTLKEELGISHRGMEVYAEYFVSGVTATYLKWLRGELPISEDDLGELVGNISYYGLQKVLPASL